MFMILPIAKHQLSTALLQLRRPETCLQTKSDVTSKKIREVLVQLKDRGKTIFVNSHILSEVEMITSRVSIIEQGQIIKSGTVADLTRSQNIYDLTIEGDAQPYLEEMLSMVKAVRPVEGGLEVHLKEGDSQ